MVNPSFSLPSLTSQSLEPSHSLPSTILSPLNRSLTPLALPHFPQLSPYPLFAPSPLPLPHFIQISPLPLQSPYLHPLPTLLISFFGFSTNPSPSPSVSGCMSDKNRGGCLLNPRLLSHPLSIPHNPSLQSLLP